MSSDLWNNFVETLSAAEESSPRTMRADGPTPCGERQPGGGMDPPTQPDSADRDVAVCGRGCGLLVPRGDIATERHCCVDALRSVTDALEERSASLEHEVRMARLRWNRREQFLLAQVASVQSEAQLAALTYQRKLHHYTLRISSIAEQLIGSDKVREGDSSSHQHFRVHTNTSQKTQRYISF